MNRLPLFAHIRHAALLLNAVFLCVCLHAAATEAIWYPVTYGTDTGTPMELRVLPQKASNVLELEVHMAGVFARSFVAEDNAVYQALDVPGIGAGAEKIGQPVMPTKSVFIEIPAGVQVTAEITSKDEVLLGKDFLIYPRQPTVPGEYTPTSPMVKSKVTYASTARFPSEIVSVGRQSVIRGHHVLQLQISPLQYVPSSGALFANRSINISLRYSGTGLATVEARPTTTSEWDRLVEPFILNYTPSLQYETQENVRTTTGADYWVIVPDAFESAVQPLVEWKHKKGWKTHVTALSEIGQNLTAEDIWEAINDAYTTWNPAPSYVLLVGDHDDLPAFTINDTEWSLSYISDHPYTLMDTNDDYFAPDIVVSRITASSSQATAGIVQKILDYEIVEAQDPPAQWYKNFCTATYFEPNLPDARPWETRTTFMETIAHIDAFLTNPVNGVNMSAHTAWYNDTELPPPYYYNAPSYPHRPPVSETVPETVYSRWRDSFTYANYDLTQAINSGVSLVAYYEHGNPERWGYPRFTRDHVNYLTNFEKLPLVLSLACLTGKFNYANGDCFAETLLEKPDGGAVGVIASTEVSAGKHNDLMAHGIMDCFWPNYDTSTLHNDPDFLISRRPTEALFYGKHYMQTYMLDDDGWRRVIWHEYAYFGEPEMHIRTDTPKSIAATWMLYPLSSSYYLFVRAKKEDNSDFPLVYCGVSNPNDEVEAFRLVTNSVGTALCQLPQGEHLDMVFTSVDGIPYQRVMGHCADTRMPFWQIDLDEVNRVIALYNSVAFHIDGSSEDCYAPGAGSDAGFTHHSDYSPADWAIDLDELMRLIQIYNSAGYTLNPTSEDGFEPVSRGGKEAGDLDEPDATLLATATWQRSAGNIAEVTCQISSDGVVPVTAMGLAIELPSGTIFQGVGAGAPPHVSKVFPDGDRVELVWVEIPALPMAVTYRLELPADANDLSEIMHDLHYRTSGPELQTRFALRGALGDES